MFLLFSDVMKKSLEVAVVVEEEEVAAAAAEVGVVEVEDEEAAEVAGGIGVEVGVAAIGKAAVVVVVEEAAVVVVVTAVETVEIDEAEAVDSEVEIEAAVDQCEAVVVEGEFVKCNQILYSAHGTSVCTI